MAARSANFYEKMLPFMRTGMSKNILVEIEEEYATAHKLPENFGIVLRGPYEHIIQFTKAYSNCEAVYDILIAGKIFHKIPCAYCTRVKRKI